MKLRNSLLACTSIATLAIGFAPGDKPGWKVDDDGKLIVDAKGDPIYIQADGREMSVQHDTISQRNREAQTNRERAETAEAELKKYEVNGKRLDPDAAVKAVETVGKIDAKALIDAGEVDKVKETIKAEFTQQITERDKEIAARDQRINDMMIDGVFKGSDFIQDRVAMPRDFFEAAMRSNFKVEDGKVVAYDKAGNRLMSKSRVGEYADPNEALELLVETHPQRDTILKAPTAGGSGNNGGGGNKGGGRTMKRADFDQLDAQQKANAGQQVAKGELTVVD